MPPAAIEAIEAVIAVEGDPRWSTWEDQLSKQAWLCGYFETRKAAAAAWLRLAAALDAGWVPGAPTPRRLRDAEWRDSYKLHFRPGHIGRLHWAPVWERQTYLAPPGDVVVWLDPGMAFGTGNHETTHLALERLVEFAGRCDPAAGGRAVLDAGCGSGILSIAAVRLGLGPVIGFDNDPAAVAVSTENAALNGLAEGIEFAAADLQAGLSGRQADLVVANIQSDVLIAHAARFAAAVSPGGWLALGGILAAELDEVRTAFGVATRGWTIESRQRGEWADLLVVRPGVPD